MVRVVVCVVPGCVVRGPGHHIRSPGVSSQQHRPRPGLVTARRGGARALRANSRQGANLGDNDNAADADRRTLVVRAGTHHAATNGGPPDPHAEAVAELGGGGVWESELLFYVNGQRTALRHAPPETTLLQYLRQAGLTGTKLGCGEVSASFVECMRA